MGIGLTLLAAGAGACGSSYQPPTVAGLTEQGDAAQAAHHLASARTDYRTALSLDPSYIPALVGLAEVSASSVPVEAASLLEQAVSEDPHDTAARRLLDRVLAEMGDSGKAVPT